MWIDKATPFVAAESTEPQPPPSRPRAPAGSSRPEADPRLAPALVDDRDG